MRERYYIIVYREKDNYEWCSQTEQGIVEVKRGAGNDYVILIKILKIGVGTKG